MAKSKEKSLALALRMKGNSIKEIASQLNVSVGSVSLWCRNVMLSDDQQTQLKNRVTDPFYGKKGTYLRSIKRDLDNKIEQLKQEGILEVGNLSKREVFLIGIALYWGEGFKKDHQVGFATSDPYMAQFFIKWLDLCWNIKRQDIILRVTANISYMNEIRLLEQYWSDKLGVPVTSFTKPFFQNVQWKKMYDNRNEYHGVIRIKVRRSVDLLRKMHGYVEALRLYNT
jgi:hypothetical protein